ncbi:Glutathione S-transferase ustS [Lecanosticta acicola]|uniref:Glutathione S-transferase ustS n=1 Tax=Lecanosticta acicola TaxID=111012 RepID=A0AAI8YVK6_9PEZI|nr:Glutathione S-transferase ustS [Lecanosticta acicola]
MASSSTKTMILYDLLQKTPGAGCWSPMVWRTRLLLNYKGIPYTTVWLKNNEIAKTLSAVGIPSNPQQAPGTIGPQPLAYTVPAVKFPDGSAVMDSAAIALKIEARYPQPKIDLAPELQAKVMPLYGQILFQLAGTFFPLIRRNILLEESIAEWTANKETTFGRSMAEMEANSGEAAWRNAEPGFEKLRELLRESKKDAGPFVLGGEVCYVDFIFGAMMECCRKVGGDLYANFARYAPELREIHEACEGKGWLEKDD